MGMPLLRKERGAAKGVNDVCAWKTRTRCGAEVEKKQCWLLLRPQNGLVGRTMLKTSRLWRGLGGEEPLANERKYTRPEKRGWGGGTLL